MTLTATADTEAPLVPPAEAPALAVPERPVFAATTPARPRTLRMAGRVTAGLVALWLVALVLGTFGFGPVAGIGLPRIGGDSGGDSKPQGEAAHRARSLQGHQRVTKSGVTLRTRQGGHAGTTAGTRGNARTAGPRRAAHSQAPASHPGGTTGSTTPGHGSSSHATGQTPAATGTPAGTATPTASTSSGSTTTTTNPHANTTHSQATPPGSSSAAPGSRSSAGTAPGRDQSSASPSPGSGRTEHAPPTG